MGSFNLQGAESVRVVWDRWTALASALEEHAPGLVSAHQVHGLHVYEHRNSWRGVLRCPDGDGHLAAGIAVAMAVSLADCVPVFIGHPSGAAAVLHAGWKGTAGRLVARAIGRLESLGCKPADLRVHCGPAICESCYEVGPEVYERVAGRRVSGPTTLDLRAIVGEHASAAGVRDISASPSCTRCHNSAFFSHRGGDEGRQLGVIVSRPTGRAGRGEGTARRS